MSSKPRREPRKRADKPAGTDRAEVAPAARPGFEPFARFPLHRMGPEWFEPNWLTSTNWLGHWDHLFPTQWPVPLPPGPGADALRIEEYDEPDAHVIRAEMPGLDPETDITVEVDHDMLTVAATREQRTESSDSSRDGGRVYRSEFSYGTFRRHIRLPAGTTAEDVTATYDAGVLEIRVARRGDDGRPPAVSIPVTPR